MAVDRWCVLRRMRILTAFVLLAALIGCEVPLPETAMSARVDASAAEIDLDPPSFDVGEGRVIDVVSQEDHRFEVHAAFDEVHIVVPAEEVDGEARILDQGSLELASYLAALTRAGARLEHDGPWIVDREGRPVICASNEDDDGVACRRGPASYVAALDEPPSEAEIPALLRAPDWTFPPSARLPMPDVVVPPPPTPAVDPWEPIDSPFAAIWQPEIRVDAIAVAGGTYFVMAMDMDMYDAILCVGAGATYACAPAGVQGLVSAVATVAHDTWLLRTATDAGGRGGGSALTLARRDADGRLHLDHLDTGGTDGEGGGCEDYEGYCVWFAGEWIDASLLSPSCLELRPGGTWHARHVRVEHLWDGESVRPAAPCVTRYRIDEGRFVESACGPPPALPTCLPRDDP